MRSIAEGEIFGKSAHADENGSFIGVDAVGCGRVVTDHSSHVCYPFRSTVEIRRGLCWVRGRIRIWYAGFRRMVGWTVIVYAEQERILMQRQAAGGFVMAWFAGFVVLLLVVSCSTSITGLEPKRRMNAGRDTAGDSSNALASGEISMPVALVNDEAVSREEFGELVAETSGGKILNEIALDRMLVKRFARDGMTFTKADVAREESILTSSLDPDPDQAVRLLRILKNRRSLGPRRFENMLRRNAMLRKLVQGDVVISEERLREEFERWYGPRFQVRLITLDTRNEAEKVLRELRKGVPFNETAAKESTDISAARGGLIAPISAKDRTYPSALREVIPDLYEGEVSPIFPVEDQFAIVQMVERIDAAKVRFEDVKETLRQTVRRGEERRLMDVLVAQLLDEAEVIVLDPAVERAWKRERSDFP